MGDLVFTLKSAERDLSKSAMERAQMPLEYPDEKISSGYKLLCVEGPDQGSTFLLDRTIVYLGSRDPSGAPRPGHFIALGDETLAREQAILAWNPTEKRYAIFQSEEARTPVKISRIPSISEKLEDDVEKRNLLTGDDMILMGGTVLLVMREERMYETWGAAKESGKMRRDDFSSTRNRDIFLLSQMEQQKPKAPHQAQPLKFEERPDFGDMTAHWVFKSDYILEIIEGSDMGMRINLMAGAVMEDRTLTLGKKGKRQNDILLDDEAVENEQALLTFQGGKFHIVNQGAKTPLLVNDAPVPPGEKTVLYNGDEIMVGETVLLYIDRRSMEKQFQYQVDVVRGQPHDVGKKLVPNKEVMILGRGQSCDLQLTDREVSREHAALIFRQGRYFLEHRSEVNPTFVNGVSVPRGKHKMLNHGDQVQLSEATVLEFRKIKTLSMNGTNGPAPKKSRRSKS
jgi:pSer/pThr/pTyr-binding forkhead associated (FHA) protein